MKLKFKIQQYQTDAVENVVRVFDGQPNLGLLEYKIDHGKVYVEQGGKCVEVKEFEYDEEDTGYKNGDKNEPKIIHISQKSYSQSSNKSDYAYLPAFKWVKWLRGTDTTDPLSHPQMLTC